MALIEAANIPFERALGVEVGAIFGGLQPQHGVVLHLGLGVGVRHQYDLGMEP